MPIHPQESRDPPPGTDERASTLRADLEAALVRALALEWANLSYRHFGNRMKPPVFVLGDGASRLGQWSPRDRTIEIARRLVLDHPWGIVIEVLKHEMAHQFVHEELRRGDETAHGEAFRELCARLGLDATASGLPRSAAPRTDDEQRALTRVAKLLALAGSDNAHEADAAMREAQRLMLRHNLEATAQAPRGYAFRHLGEPSGRLQQHQRVLAAILGSHFFVETIWVSVYRPREGKPGTVLEVCGSDANLEMASYVHDFLLRAAESLWREHKRARRMSSDAHRRSYLAGVMRGFDEKLVFAAAEQHTEGLIVQPDRGLADYFARRYPRTRTMRSAGRSDAATFSAGHRAGHALVLHKPVGGGPAGSGGSSRLLGPHRS